MPLPTLLTTTVANACSSDGSVIVGSAPSGGGTVACWWDKTTQTLTLLTQPSGITFSSAYDCSSDGSIIIGNDDNGAHAYWWDKTTGTPTELLPPSGGDHAQVFGCSSDGNTIVGQARDPVTGFHAVWWNKTTGAATVLNDLSVTFIGALARSVSGDGSVAVGYSIDNSNNIQPVWWNISTSVITAMSWPGGNQPSSNSNGPYDCSNDGSIIIGSGNDNLGNSVACFWDKSTGTPTLLQQISGSTNGGRALGVSDNGITICGWALDSSSNQPAVVWNKTSNTISQLDFDPSADTTISDGGIGISADGTVVVGNNYINPGDVQTAVFWSGVSPPNPIDLFLQGRVFSASRAREQINFVTAIRARIRANSGLKGLFNWPDYSLSLQAKVTSGARALGALVPGNTVLAARIRANANLRQLLSGVTNIPVFPTLPVGFPVVVKPTFANISGSITSGRSMRAPQQTLPIWEFELNFESLRDQTQNSQPFAPLAGFTDFTKLAQIFIANIGQYGKFLFDAWWDDSRLDQPIALGDGTSMRFLMVRTWGYGSIQFTEPVGSVNIITNVKINGTVQDPSTYFITSNNVLVFRSAPADGVTITSTFSYYYLCQFSEDMQDYSEFMKNRWTAKIKFRSVESTTPFTLSGPVAYPPPIPQPQITTPPATLNGIAIFGCSSSSAKIFVGSTSPDNFTIKPCYWVLPSKEPITLVSTGGPYTDGYGVNSVLCSSSDGNIVAGNDNKTAVSWNRQTNTENILNLPIGCTNPSAVLACSLDGTIFTGFATSPTAQLPIRWINGVPFILQISIGKSQGVATGCSSDGLTVCGYCYSTSTFDAVACTWDVHGNVTVLPAFPVSTAGPTTNGMNADGSVIVGRENGGPVIWKAGSIFKLPVLGVFTLDGEVAGISKDGTVAVGWYNDPIVGQEPCFWSINGLFFTFFSLNDGVFHNTIAECIMDDNINIGGSQFGTTPPVTHPRWWSTI